MSSKKKDKGTEKKFTGLNLSVELREFLAAEGKAIGVNTLGTYIRMVLISYRADRLSDAEDLKK